MLRAPTPIPLIPAQAGIQCYINKVGNLQPWIPAFAGTSG
jgi:hypothetical protein